MKRRLLVLLACSAVLQFTLVPWATASFEDRELVWPSHTVRRAYNRAKAALAQDEPEAALRILQGIYTTQPDLSDESPSGRLCRLAVAYGFYCVRDFERAEPAFHSILEHDPADDTSRAFYGLSLLAQKKTAAADEQWKILDASQRRWANQWITYPLWLVIEYEDYLGVDGTRDRRLNRSSPNEATEPSNMVVWWVVEYLWERSSPYFSIDVDSVSVLSREGDLFTVRTTYHIRSFNCTRPDDVQLCVAYHVVSMRKEGKGQWEGELTKMLSQTCATVTEP